MSDRTCARHANPLVGWRQRKLCEQCRAEIRNGRGRGATLYALACRYGVCVNAVWRVCRQVEPAVPSLAERVAAVRALGVTRGEQP